MSWTDALWKKPEDKKTATEPAKNTKQNTNTARPGSIPNSNNNIISPNPGMAVPAGGDTQEFIDYFKKVFADANIPGPDFNEFVSALDMLKAQPMDEQSKYVSIFASMTVQGVTKQRLIDTAQVYIDKFAEKHQSFTAALQDMNDNEIGGRQAAMDNLAKENNDIDVEMKRLADKKMANAEEINKMNMELNEQSTKLSIKKTNFESTYNKMVNEIKVTVENIKRYIA